MFKSYSTEYAAILATLLAPVFGNYLSDACAGEVSGVVAGTAIALVGAGYALLKRYQRGQEGKAEPVTPLGFRK